MRIGVNALYLVPGGVGGSEVYLRSLVAALARLDPAHEFFLYTNQETGTELTPAAPNFHARPQAVRARFRAARVLWEQLVLPWQIAADRLDVIFNPGFTAPLWTTIAQVTVFHDLQHKRHPQYFRWFDLPAWRFLLWAAARRSRRLIAVSEATRDDLLHFYRYPKERIDVIGHGVDERFFEIGRERSAPEPLLLCVSTLHPHKNLERLVQVFARLRRSHPQLRLVLAGMRGFHTGAIEEAIRSLDLKQAVTLTGWIPREELYELYRRALAFVYPSTFEGFGMPVLEALAAGLPTACADIEPVRSVAGNAAWLFDPHNDDAMLEALERIVRGDATGEPGPARARQFSWEATARATVASLERAAG